MRLGLASSVLAAALALGACQRPAPLPFVKSAKFGIFFGGQIEERRDVPFVLDRTKQSQGFRVEFSQPLAADTPVEWRIDLPKTPTPAKRKPPHGAPPPEAVPHVQTGSGVARAGTNRFDQETPFQPGDPLGVWNVRVVVRGAVVIDRPVEVFDEAARDRLTPPDGG